MTTVAKLREQTVSLLFGGLPEAEKQFRLGAICKDVESAFQVTCPECSGSNIVDNGADNPRELGYGCTDCMIQWDAKPL